MAVRITGMFSENVTVDGVSVQLLIGPVLDEIGRSLAKRIDGAPGRPILLVSDQRVGTLYGDRVAASFVHAGLRVAGHTLPVGESAKSLANAGAVYETLRAMRIGRDGWIVALGGGAVSDLTGFVAATWMRGIRWAIIPTTLEAMVDAAIGGKTAVNLPGGKNLVGAFHQPSLVAMDPTALKSLPPRDVRAGLAESVKHALLSDESYLAWHEEYASQILVLEDGIIRELIARSVRYKTDVVQHDPRETTGARIVLNLGHTIGHAIEAHCGGIWRHGECVALGMVAACRLSEAMGLLDAAVVKRVIALLSSLELPVRLPRALDVERVMRSMLNDKKVEGGRLRFVLLEGIGRPVVIDAVPSEMVRDVLSSLAPDPGLS